MPTESSIHLLLGSLFEYYLRAEDSGFPPQSILYRIATEGFASRPQRAGHNILCADMTSDLRRVQAGYNALDYELKIIVAMKHSPPPLKEDGKLAHKCWGDREKAQNLDIPASIFKSKYRKSLRKIKSMPLWHKK
jgi:hypothetical protein